MFKLLLTPFKNLFIKYLILSALWLSNNPLFKSSKLSIKYLNSLFIPLIKRYSFLYSLAYSGILLVDLIQFCETERRARIPIPITTLVSVTTTFSLRLVVE